VRSEELFALASARGVDLVGAAREGTPPPLRDVTTKRLSNGHTAQILKIAPKSGAKGKESRNFKRPVWSLAELGQAARGVPSLYFSAACYAFCGSQAEFWNLHAALCDQANSLRQRYRWPDEVFDVHRLKQPYLRHLAKLVLDEDNCPYPFTLGGGALFPCYMNVSPRVWENELSERYEALREIWLQWLGTAARMIQPRLRERNPEEEDDGEVL
jgi:hypothetical protein